MLMLALIFLCIGYEVGRNRLLADDDYEHTYDFGEWISY